MAREAGFFKRLRKLTPVRAAWTFVVGMGSGTANTLADFVRLFADLTGERMSYKPFHDRLSNRSFPEFLRRLCEQLMAELIGPILQTHGGKLSVFDDIWIQDGTSFALNDRLVGRFPGRFTQISPAAAEVHCTYSVLQGQAVSISVAPDSQGERDFLPDPAEVSGKLLLMDRGYVSYSYFKEVDVHGGSYICRAKDKKINPTIVECVEGFSNKVALQRRKLANVRLPRKTVDLIVKARGAGKTFTMRLVIFWVRKTKKHVYLYTNLSSCEFPPDVVASTYRLRWQVELFFKECKSYTQLQKFQTADPHIAEGLMWASVIAVLIRRFLTYEAHENEGRRSAPLVAAAVSWLFFRDLGRSAVRKHGQFRRAIAKALALLRDVAARTNLGRGSTHQDLELAPSCA